MDPKIKLTKLQIQNGDFSVNPKIITNEIDTKLKKMSSKLKDWGNGSEIYSKNNSPRVDMDAKIIHRKEREGD